MIPETAHSCLQLAFSQICVVYHCYGHLKEWVPFFVLSEVIPETKNMQKMPFSGKPPCFLHLCFLKTAGNSFPFVMFFGPNLPLGLVPVLRCFVLCLFLARFEAIGSPCLLCLGGIDNIHVRPG